MNQPQEQKPDYIHSYGPESDLGWDGDESPIWYVTLMTDREEELEAFKCYDWKEAYELGDELAEKYDVEHVPECTPA
jgi:hypothetical protein